MPAINDFRELRVYQKAFEMSSNIFELSKLFPKEKMYSLTDQIRRSSRSVGSNIAEAFRRRIYPKSLVSKLNESEAEAAETQHWLDTAYKCKYIEENTYNQYRKLYDEIIGMIVNMRRTSSQWNPK